GELTGEQEKAQELSTKIGERRDEIVGSLDKEAKPRVLLLMARGGKKMITAPSTMASGLVKEAGGELISEAEGMRGAAPADPRSGELTGEQEKAQELSTKIGERRDEIVGSLDKEAKPRVLLLMARGGKKMITAPSTMASGLVKEAGGELISEAEGMRGAAPADP